MQKLLERCAGIDNAKRELTRRRKRLLGAVNSERNRVQKMLERGNVKIGNVVSDVGRISGQRILQVLLRKPDRIAELAILEGRRLDARLISLSTFPIYYWSVVYTIAILVYTIAILRNNDMS